ncbi:MAG: CapA family protein [Thermoleophilia bacterium]|jgi:poly-gamma-glutamate capsule biosynthesis protein CapA/YwtB (metallophosphatase superfamily)
MSMYRYILVALVGLALLVGSLLLAARPQAAESTYEITWLGDTFLGDRGRQLLDEKGYSAAFDRLPDIGASDLTIINAEAPLTDLNILPASRDIYYTKGSTTPRYDIYTSRGKVTRYVHRSSPESATAFAQAGVDGVTLANNHAFDQGAQGMQDSIAVIRKTGMTPIGAGNDLREAMQPYVVDTPYGRVAIFAFGKEGGTVPAATVSTPGLLTLSSTNLDATGALAKKADAKWKVAMVHWGRNYTNVDSQQQKWAERFADRGFDLVVGTGPHVAQRIEIIKRTVVAYSLGNFVFQQRGRFTSSQEGYGLILTTGLGPNGFRDVRVTCIDVDNKRVNYQPCAASPADAARILPRISSALTINGAEGMFTW